MGTIGLEPSLTKIQTFLPPPLSPPDHWRGADFILSCVHKDFQRFSPSVPSPTSSVFSLTGWRAARGLAAMLAQKTSSSLTRQTGSPTDGLYFLVKNFSLHRREANFFLGRCVLIFCGEAIEFSTLLKTQSRQQCDKIIARAGERCSQPSLYYLGGSLSSVCRQLDVRHFKAGG